MGYCYTRDAGLFALADGMGGHPEGEVASQVALQTLSAPVPARGQAAPGRAAALPARRHHRRPPPTAALRHRACAGRHAAHHGGGLPAAGQRRLLGALRRFAPVPGARRQAGGAHARPFLFRTAGNAVAGGAHGRPGQPQRALHLPGQPGQAGGRHRRPAAGAPRRPRDAVLRRPVGVGARRRHHRGAGRNPDLRRRARTGRTGAAPAGPKSDNVTVLAVEWEAAETPLDSKRASPPCRWATTCLRPPSRPAWVPAAGDELDDAEIERSIREINEAIQRSSKRR
jgi:hypothetical protein